MTTVITRMHLALPPRRTWEAVTFYEGIPGKAPLPLRLLLPSPIRTEGRAAKVGDVSRCLYGRGHLTKRVTRVEPCQRYEFEVVEQTLPIGGGLRLLGGSFTLREQLQGGTLVALETRYASPHRPRWLWAPIEATACHAFHRHILRAMRTGPAQSESL